VTKPSPIDIPCPFPGCPRVIRCAGLCNTHYRQRRMGIPLRPAVTKSRKPRPLVSSSSIPGTLLIPLTQGLHALIDANDADFVGASIWYAVLDGVYRNRRYAMGNVRQ
jgi:hypothetical protein